MLPRPDSLGAFLWRRRLDGYSDTDLATKLRDNVAWRESQLAEKAVLRLAAHDGLPGAEAALARWDAAVEWAFDAITARLIVEARRRSEARRGPRQAVQRISVIDLAARFPSRLHAIGSGRYRARCPWHDDSSPSLTMFPDGWAHCFGCGAHRPVADVAAIWRAEA